MSRLAPLPRLTEVRACLGHLRRGAMLRRQARRKALENAPLDRRLFAFAWPYAWRTISLSVLLLLPARRLAVHPGALIALTLLFGGLPLAALGNRLRRMSDFERLRMPDPAALVAARWLRAAPLITACGVAWLLGAWLAPAAKMPTAGQALGALVAPWFVVVSGGRRFVPGVPSFAWGLFDLAGLLLAGAVAYTTLDMGQWMGGFGETMPKLRALIPALVLGGMTVGTAWISLRSLRSALREPDDRSAEALEVASEGGASVAGIGVAEIRDLQAGPAGRTIAARSWPTEHRGVVGRARGDLRLTVAAWRYGTSSRHSRLARVLVVVLTAFVPLWNVLGAAAVVVATDAGSARLPGGILLVGLLLFRPVGVGPDEHRWMLGSDYRDQARAETWLLLWTAWVPRLVAVALAVAWCVRRDGHVATEPIAAALLLLAAGLPVVGMNARKVWRPWAGAPWWCKGGVLLALVATPPLLGGLSAGPGLAAGLVLGSVGTLWTLQALFGLSEPRLLQVARHEAE